MKEAFFCGALPFTSTKTCVGDSLSDFHKNLGPHFLSFSEFTSFNRVELSSIGFPLVGT